MALVFIIRQNYYGNAEEILEREAQSAANSYDRYPANSLQKNAKILLENTIRDVDAQVQVINSEGIVLADSELDELVGQKLNLPDVENSLKDKTMSKWIGKVSSTDEPIISVSYPLKSGNEVIGVLRLVSTLSRVNNEIFKIVLFFAVISFVVLSIVLVLGYFLSRTITGPVKEITVAAEKMARGELDVRVPKRYDDEVGKLAVTLNYMAKEIADHQKTKDDLIASISHELRTPLTSIKGWAATLNSGSFTDINEIREGLGIIENETDRLAFLANELLDYTKLSTKNVSIGLDIVDVGEFLCEIRNQMNPRAQRHSIDLKLELEDDLAFIKADRNRLKQVMINILDNSLKYTQEGGFIKISSQSQRDEILISIEDSGIGIPEEDLPRIKEKYYKVSTSFSGNGLGLSICDEIISLHNGRLEISSIYGEGTRVDIYLPITQRSNL
ncbi:MAG: Alkaline phosphatase synthesis sensor protein PhoR [Firmicutes bacterium ADurb.Bin419]|nr:MAG: Alkaline phosphatase synthesis sensor protein PhoR [Firmicutes bacterium ADurb.Bin419]